MKPIKLLKFYFFPIFVLILPAMLGLFFEGYNRYYRGVATPFLYPSIGLIVVSLFFWAKGRWTYLILIGLTGAYLFFFSRHYLWLKPDAQSNVYYYKNWIMNTKDGQIHLKDPLGKHPPEKGPYISCSFSFDGWKSYLNFQPSLCTAFDNNLRLKMYLHDQITDEGMLREFHLNLYVVDRKSLLGEPLDRAALRVAFSLKNQGINPQYKVKAIYQVYEREITPGRTKVVESFSRDPNGRLKQFTESPLLKFSNSDVYAVYDSQGLLVEIPRMKGKSFSFPAQIDVKEYRVYPLPEKISSQGNSS